LGVLAEQGLDPKYVPCVPWLVKVSQVYVEVAKAMDEYSTFHTAVGSSDADKGIMDGDKYMLEGTPEEAASGDCGPSWQELCALHVSAGEFFQNFSHHLDTVVKELFDRNEKVLEDIYASVSSDKEFLKALVEAPSTAYIKDKLFTNAPKFDGKGSSDQLEIAAESHTLLDEVFQQIEKFINTTGAKLPLLQAALEEMKGSIEKASLFVCIGSTWDLLINSTTDSKKQKKVDADALKASVKASLFKLIYVKGYL